LHLPSFYNGLGSRVSRTGPLGFSTLGERLSAEGNESVSLSGSEEGLHFLGLPGSVVAEDFDTVFVGDDTGTEGAVHLGNEFQSANA
jgi:hypothetical protein